MANAWENPSLIAAEALMHLEDALVIAPLAARDKTGEFTQKQGGYAIGDQVSIKTRPEYEAKEFTGTGPVTKQDVRSSKRPFTLEKIYDISVDVTAREKKLNLDSFAEEVIIPAVYTLAEKVDTYLGTKIVDAAGIYASDTLLSTAADVALARKEAILQQLSPTGRFALVDPNIEASLLGQTWFNQSQTRGSAGETTLQTGQMGRVMGMDWYSSVNFPTTAHTAGNGTSTTNNGGGTNNLIGSTTLTIASLTGQIEAGDRIAIAGVKRPLIAAAQAVATSTTVTLTDPITEIIPDSAAVSVKGSGQSLTHKGAIFDDQSLGLAMPPLDPPSDKPSFVVSNNGYSIRIVQGYDMDSKVETMSLDVLVGAVCYDPRRITLLSEY